MNAGMPNPVKAKMYAEIAHAGQVYNSEVPYTYHLESVVKVLERFGITTPVMICAAWLHDTIEDMTRSYNDIASRFGEEVAEIVYNVTSELGRNRKERNEKTYPKIASSNEAVILKLADRIANVEYGIANDGKHDMYAKEFSGFYAALAWKFPANGNEELNIQNNMWNHLKRLLRIE